MFYAKKIIPLCFILECLLLSLFNFCGWSKPSRVVQESKCSGNSHFYKNNSMAHAEILRICVRKNVAFWRGFWALDSGLSL